MDSDKYKNYELMQKITENSIPSLCTTVLGALELFEKEGLPQIKFPSFKKPIIMGSGNAIATARVLYWDQDVIFTTENNFKEAAELENDGAIIFSASGEKHASIVANYYKSKGIDAYLVTCNSNSTAGEILGEDKVIVTSKNPEPYTYNTSTYLGWVIAKTKENPKEIIKFIKEHVDPAIPKNIASYEGYLLVTPNDFFKINSLFHVKFKELFARKVSRDVETFEGLKHAVTVVPCEKELCIQFGEGEVEFSKDRKIIIPLPKGADTAAVMAIGYYVIGKIQEGKPQWFKESIGDFIKKLNKTKFGKNLSVIVK